ncbi:hypothetical protein MP228_000638 [Amoeboaphelidium protococcarum]|nr:hypothetical protein MP228_000638 [Amoeboaphelidium protococcarum]
MDSQFVDWENAGEFEEFVPQAYFKILNILLLSLGFLLASSFLIYQVNTVPSQRSLLRELSMAVPASVLLGFGSLFLMQSFGIYL